MRHHLCPCFPTFHAFLISVVTFQHILCQPNPPITICHVNPIHSFNPTFKFYFFFFLNGDLTPQCPYSLPTKFPKPPFISFTFQYLLSYAFEPHFGSTLHMPLQVPFHLSCTFKNKKKSPSFTQPTITFGTPKKSLKLYAF